MHNALMKICIDMNNRPEEYLTLDIYYNSKVVGEYCEECDPQLSFPRLTWPRGVTARPCTRPPRSSSTPSPTSRGSRHAWCTSASIRPYMQHNRRLRAARPSCSTSKFIEMFESYNSWRALWRMIALLETAQLGLVFLLAAHLRAQDQEPEDHHHGDQRQELDPDRRFGGGTASGGEERKERCGHLRYGFRDKWLPHALSTRPRAQLRATSSKPLP